MAKQRGQLVVEMVLLLVVGIGFMTFAINALKDMKLVSNITVQPWATVSGMVECGVWSACGVSTPAPGMFPSNRPVSYKPEGQ